jgi:hypothetical protein
MGSDSNMYPLQFITEDLVCLKESAKLSKVGTEVAHFVLTAIDLSFIENTKGDSKYCIVKSSQSIHLLFCKIQLDDLDICQFIKQNVDNCNDDDLESFMLNQEFLN